MSKVKIILSEESIKEDSKVRLGDVMQVYLMEGDIECNIISYEVNGKFLDVIIEVSKGVYERLEFEEDKILDIVELDMYVDDMKTLHWSFESSSLL